MPSETPGKQSVPVCAMDPDSPLPERLDLIEVRLAELTQAINSRLARLEGDLGVMVSTYRAMNVELQGLRQLVDPKTPVPR